MTKLPPLSTGWAPALHALHGFARAAIAVPRAHGEPQPHWGQAGFTLSDTDFVSAPIPLADGSSLVVRFDLFNAVIEAHRDGTAIDSMSMLAAFTPTQVGDRIVALAAEQGLHSDVDRDRYVDDTPGVVGQDVGAGLWDVFRSAAQIFGGHASSLDGEVGQLHFWPHHFDLSVEWYGTRMVELDGETYPAQINLGLYVLERPYFYSNPWPFDRALMDVPLPHGASWTVEEFEGSILYYDQIADDPDATDKIAGYARAVWEAASPGLMA